MEPNEQLLNAIIARTKKNAEFNTGILTADRYVRTLLDCVGSDACYKFATTKAASFDDVLRKSAKTLVYNNDEMVIEDLYGKPGEWKAAEYKWFDGEGFEKELPKNTLMVFKHVLTTPKKDRDGDVMRTQGAKPDPKMLLLWQHVHTLPIGKMLAVSEHNPKKLVVVSAIVDMNELSHDAAVMVDNDMGRFSHGFRALEFSKIKEGGGDEESGFDVKSFEIMEESLVSVPSNTDAEVQEVILSLSEGGKLTSGIMKSVGKSIREKQPKRAAVGVDVKSLPLRLDLQVTVNGQPVGDTKNATPGTNGTKCEGKPNCGCGCQNTASAPEKAGCSDEGAEPNADDKEMMICPKCGERMAGGKCTKCGYEMDKTAAPGGTKDAKSGEKYVNSPYVYPGQIEDSFESISWGLRQSAMKFLETSGLIPKKTPDGPDRWQYTDVIATFSDHAIIAFENEDGRRYFQADWKKVTGEFVFSGVPKEVTIRTTTMVLEKAFRLSKQTKNCGTGAGGFQPGNTCASGSGGGESSGESAAADFNAAHEQAQRTFSQSVTEALAAFRDALGSAGSLVNLGMGAHGLLRREPEVCVKDACEIILTKATPEERRKLRSILETLDEIDEMKQVTKALAEIH